MEKGKSCGDSPSVRAARLAQRHTSAADETPRTLDKFRVRSWNQESPKLWEARSPLYRGRCFQVNTHFAVC